MKKRVNIEYKKRLKKIKRMKLHYLLVCFLGGEYRTKWLKKKNIFGMMGKDVLYQPKTLPNEPELIKIHDNVRIAADVTFYTHDVIYQLLTSMDGENYRPHRGCIEIFDNVFIGGKSIILDDVSIGPNAIVAAGSVVTKDVPSGTVVGGNPAKVIGNFDDLHIKRSKLEKGDYGDIPTTEKLWADFYERKNITMCK